ncbi:DUF6710 family protein [Paenibacillus dendritiformis]|uniref:DUF6710 family protein n=1 Tax=Paenibacillus dendritiformis TaxID=130049 RepID=UPI00387E09B1
MLWWKKKNNTKVIQQEKFSRMMQIADNIIYAAETHNKKKENNSEFRHPVYDYIKLLGMGLQTKYLMNLLYTDDHGKVKRYPDITSSLLFIKGSEILTSDYKTMFDLYDLNYRKEKVEIDLRRDLVLPWPWALSRLINSISFIGEERHWGDWEEDTLNHNLELWLPVRLCFVNSGNHSIASGIIQGEGKLNSRTVFDMSVLYDHVYTDGINYYRSFDHSVISNVELVEFAVIFEVGRKKCELGIS